MSPQRTQRGPLSGYQLTILQENAGVTLPFQCPTYQFDSTTAHACEKACQRRGCVKRAETVAVTIPVPEACLHSFNTNV